MKISENTELKIDLKTLISVVIFVTSFVSVYFAIQSDINEVNLKREWMEQHIRRSEEEIKELKKHVKELDKELHFKLKKQRG